MKLHQRAKKIVERALEDSCVDDETARGRCLDARLGWRVMGKGKCGDDDAGLVDSEEDDSRKLVESQTFDRVLADGVVTGMMISSLFDAVFFRSRGSRVVLSGSTGSRYLLAHSGAMRTEDIVSDLEHFPPSDADVDVYATADCTDGVARTIDSVDRAATDIVHDNDILREVLARVPDYLECGGKQNARNSRVYTTNSKDDLVGVDVPSFGTNRRLPYRALFVTKNETVPGLPCLHRIRLQLSEGDRRFSIPLMDIKTRSDPVPRLSRPILVGGTLVRVPTAIEATRELDKLLDGTYERVDGSKSERRRDQRRVLRKMIK